MLWLLLSIYNGTQVSCYRTLRLCRICHFDAQNVYGNDDPRVGKCGVPFRGGRGSIYDTKSAPGGKVHGCDGAVASTYWSGDPGPVPASSFNACMNCRYCFSEGPVSPAE